MIMLLARVNTETCCWALPIDKVVIGRWLTLVLFLVLISNFLLQTLRRHEAGSIVSLGKEASLVLISCLCSFSVSRVFELLLEYCQVLVEHLVALIALSAISLVVVWRGQIQIIILLDQESLICGGGGVGMLLVFFSWGFGWLVQLCHWGHFHRGRSNFALWTVCYFVEWRGVLMCAIVLRTGVARSVLHGVSRAQIIRQETVRQVVTVPTIAYTVGVLLSGLHVRRLLCQL